MYNKIDDEEISCVLSRIGIYHRMRLGAEIVTLAWLFTLSGWLEMGKAARWWLAGSVLAYVVFFLWMADRAPRITFAAGILLGAVLIGLWLVTVLRKK